MKKRPHPPYSEQPRLQLPLKKIHRHLAIEAQLEMGSLNGKMGNEKNFKSSGGK